MNLYYLDNDQMIIAHNKKSILAFTFYNNDDKVCTWAYCHSEKAVRKSCDKNNMIWTHAMVYVRPTGEKIGRIYKERY